MQQYCFPLQCLCDMTINIINLLLTSNCKINPKNGLLITTGSSYFSVGAGGHLDVHCRGPKDVKFNQKKTISVGAINSWFIKTYASIFLYNTINPSLSLSLSLYTHIYILYIYVYTHNIIHIIYIYICCHKFI